MQIVTFQLAGERYGLPIDTIQEIIMDRDVTRVPNLPTFLKGIIHLRDSVIPIVDGIERLGYHDREKGFENGRIVIVEYNKQLIGIRVATADDVLDIDEESIQSSPEMINEFGGQFVKGVIEIDRAEESAGDVSQGHPGLRSASSSPSGETTEHEDNKQESILLLDLDELFTGEEIEKIRETREEHRGEDT